MSFDLDVGCCSQAGRRPHNEDCVALRTGQGPERDLGTVIALADGVSTGGLGAEAARTTVHTLLSDYFNTPATWDTTVALDRVISAHNAWLAGMNRRRAPLLGQCTLTALALRGQSYTLAHVGDTRAYLWRNGQLQQLTFDHVMPHPDLRHQLTRCVGADERLLVDYQQGDLMSGDCLVLLSDGVHGALSPRTITQCLRQNPPTDADLPASSTPQASAAQRLAETLVQLALRHGSEDNASAAVVLVQGISEVTLQDAQRRAQQLPAPPRLQVGEQIDGLQVQSLLADTGSHLLYLVSAAPHSRPIASDPCPTFVLKAVHPSRAHDAVERSMLAHEAWVAARMQTGQAGQHLAHLHTSLPAHGTHAHHELRQPSAFYLLYDWHAGATLAQRLQNGPPLGMAQTIGVVLQAAQALGQLHRHGVIHRDIKPDNLHLGNDGVLRILDLGVALTGREPEATRLLHAGTPSYMNPEQWPGYQGNEALPPDAGSDLYALGVTLYQLLTHGRLPYGEVLPYQNGRFRRDPTPPSRLQPGVPIWLDHIALKAVARDQARRFETAEELALALERGASRPLSAPPPTPLATRWAGERLQIALALSLLVNLVLLAWLLFLPR